MGFLDNSGDIILDAVLTDFGRKRMAEGSFNIAKFSLGDDEINYELYNKDHANGSAYYDLDLLQTPILEAFTNNTSMMKHKLLMIKNPDLLYLPVLRLNETAHSDNARNSTSNQALVGGGDNKFVVLVDADTSEKETLSSNPGLFANSNGVMRGTTGDKGTTIRIDQGLDTNEIDPTVPLKSFDLYENQYKIEIDARLGKIATKSSANPQIVPFSFLDDDNIHHYYISAGSTSTGTLIGDLTTDTSSADKSESVIKGPRGTKLEFKILSSIDLQQSDFLFDKLGASGNWTRSSDASSTVQSVKYIDTVVRITGQTTGARIDIPVRFVKMV